MDDFYAPGMTVRYYVNRVMENAVIETVLSDSVIAIDLEGRRVTLPFDRISLAKDARTRRLVSMLLEDPIEFKRETTEYLSAWKARHSVQGSAVRKTGKRGRPRRELGEAPIKVLSFIKSQGVPVSRADILNKCGLNGNDYMPVMRELVESGKVRKTGERKGTRYAVPTNALF